MKTPFNFDFIIKNNYYTFNFQQYRFKRIFFFIDNIQFLKTF